MNTSEILGKYRALMNTPPGASQHEPRYRHLQAQIRQSSEAMIEIMTSDVDEETKMRLLHLSGHGGSVSKNRQPDTHIQLIGELRGRAGLGKALNLRLEWLLDTHGY